MGKVLRGGSSGTGAHPHPNPRGGRPSTADATASPTARVSSRQTSDPRGPAERLGRRSWEGRPPEGRGCGRGGGAFKRLRARRLRPAGKRSNGDGAGVRGSPPQASAALPAPPIPGAPQRPTPFASSAHLPSPSRPQPAASAGVAPQMSVCPRNRCRW